MIATEPRRSRANRAITSAEKIRRGDPLVGRPKSDFRNPSTRNLLTN